MALLQLGVVGAVLAALQVYCGGVPLGLFFGSMLLLSIVAYYLDHRDGADAGVSAFFIDNKTRSTEPASSTRSSLKVALLVYSLVIEYDILFNASATHTQGSEYTMRSKLCFACAAVFVARILVQMWFFWHREISWVEVFAEAGGVIPLSLASFAYGARQHSAYPMGAAELVGLLLFLFGTFLNLWPEYTRHTWKSRPGNAGHLYTEGLFKFCRHINYFGEVLSFAGFALVSGPWWNLWVPLVMGAGMAVFSVPELDAYLSRRYPDGWAKYIKEVPCQMFPFIW